MAILNLVFVEPEGKRVAVEARKGDSLLKVAHDNNIDLEGACEGSLACSTCHVILPEDLYNKLSSPSDQENDMLDMAFGLTQTSRLGCQVQVDQQFQGVEIRLPAATRNISLDGKVPKHE